MTRGFIAGIVATIVVALVVAYFLLQSGFIPANADAAPGGLELWAANTSLSATLRREAPSGPNPVSLSDENLLAGIKLYAKHCAVCHGTAAGDASTSPIARGEYPRPPQLASDGVEDDSEGVSFWKIKHGIRLTGMPAWSGALSDQEIWSLALFLKHMDKLPPRAEVAWRLVKN
ncbi:MAG TPA: cytochrome c [Rhizomicrobium sp.]|nr:cytochrome c [Rhizomicrobium sp.]